MMLIKSSLLRDPTPVPPPSSARAQSSLSVCPCPNIKYIHTIQPHHLPPFFFSLLLSSSRFCLFRLSCAIISLKSSPYCDAHCAPGPSSRRVLSYLVFNSSLL